MVSAKKLVQLARKWQKMVAIRRKRITLPRATLDTDTNSCSTSTTVVKGHFVVYSADQKRFVLPLEYLKNEIVMELFNLAEEEFGVPGNGLLILPCDAPFLEYVIDLIKRKPSKDIEKALILSVASSRCSSSNHYQHETSQHSAQQKLFSFLRSLHSLPPLVLLNILSHFTKANKMISAKKLIKLARKWQKIAAIKRKRITFSRTSGDVVDTISCSTSSEVKKGHFVVYSADEKRFVLPLEYLKNKIVMELFNLAEEFGLSGNGVLILPCDATFMEYVIALVKRNPSKAVEQALILSIASDHCISSYLYQEETSQQLLICSF
ncbi:hypothetical protein Gotri_027335 [Gossypium trilobum]|uniref:Uncharacterized protein n=2 Tax=Gossypium TaxID=3633 RepID=A0A7J9FGP1_9ROSI|nr:hypothetical protein [Gossypium trilobum]